MYTLYQMYYKICNGIAGVPEIGAVGRGENMEITTYLEKSMEQNFLETL